MKFKKDAIKPDMVIHCPKEEDARELYKYCGIEFYQHTWDTHKDDTCYHVCGTNEIQNIGYGSSKYYLKRGFEITEFSDLIEPEYGIGEMIKPEDIMEARVTIESDNINDDTALLATVEQEYYLSDSDTELIGGEWSLNSGKAEGKYIWSRDKYTYSDGIARYGNMACRGYSMKAVPDAEPNEMSAVEVLEWLNVAKRHPDTMEEAFGVLGVGAFGSIFDCNTPRKILERITAYEASKKVSKPIEYEWGDVITLHDLGDEIESRFVPLSEDYKDEMKVLLKEYVENYGRPVSALYVTHGAGLRVKEES